MVPDNGKPGFLFPSNICDALHHYSPGWFRGFDFLGLGTSQRRLFCLSMSASHFIAGFCWLRLFRPLRSERRQDFCTLGVETISFWS